jgi:hypothetical protein
MSKERRIYGQEDPMKRGIVVSPEQRRERLDVIEQLMIRGVTQSKIEKACAERFKMSRGAVSKYMDTLRVQWADEERAARMTNKTAAQRRLYAHIQKAKDSENWGAVASFERLLSEIQGTREAMEVNLNVDATVTEATLHVVANLTPEQRANIIAEQRRLRELAAKATEVPAIEQAIKSE